MTTCEAFWYREIEGVCISNRLILIALGIIIIILIGFYFMVSRIERRKGYYPWK